MSWRVRSPQTLKHRWSLRGHYADVIGLAHGTAFNAPTWAENLWGAQCMVTDGVDQYVNAGDITELNAVTAFTLTCWLNQDVLGQQDRVFFKYGDADNNVQLLTDTDPALRFMVENGGNGYGEYDYTATVNALSWWHVAAVYDGTLTGNAERMKLYVNAELQTLAFTGTIPATSPDLAGEVLTMSGAGNAWDGEISDVRVYNCALTLDEVGFLAHERSGI